MPKNRKRATAKGAKSMPIRTKHKIGGRKSGYGAKQTSEKELNVMLSKVRKRDRNKLRRAIAERSTLPS